MLLSNSRIFTQMEIQMPLNFDQCSTLMVIKHRGFFNGPYLLRHGIPVFMISPRTGDSHICCQVFGSGAVITCFNDLVLSLLCIRSQSVACEGNDTNRATARVLSKILYRLRWSRSSTCLLHHQPHNKHLRTFLFKPLTSVEDIQNLIKIVIY